jgi:hypothetical protein
MATSNFSKIVTILFVAAGLACTAHPEAMAQSQMQGNLVGSSMPPNMGKQSQSNKRAMRKECAEQGKQKGLKGRELRSFEKDCVDGTLPAPVNNSPPPAAPKTAPEPGAQPAAK